MSMYIAKLMYHKWEEEPISGIKSGHAGTFAIFFYCCNMKCIYCQNSKISHIPFSEIKKKANTYNSKFNATIDSKDVFSTQISNHKIIWTAEELSDEMIIAEKNNAASISFITSVLYTEEVAETIKLARKKGLTIPIVYNSSGYETVPMLKKLSGLIDIYLPDFKYFDNELGQIFSKVPNYTDIAKLAIDEMYNQVKNNLIVRHLVLPGHTENAKNIIKYLYETYGDNIYISIMSQYTPIINNNDIKNFPNLMRTLTKREYDKVINFAMNLGIKNAYYQDGDVANESFIPEFL